MAAISAMPDADGVVLRVEAEGVASELRKSLGDRGAWTLTPSTHGANLHPTAT